MHCQVAYVARMPVEGHMGSRVVDKSFGRTVVAVPCCSSLFLLLKIPEEKEECTSSDGIDGRAGKSLGQEAEAETHVVTSPHPFIAHSRQGVLSLFTSTAFQ